MPEYSNHFYFAEFAPGVHRTQGSRLLEDVMAADALILTELAPMAVSESLPNVPRGDSDVNEAVRANFCLRGSVGKTQIWDSWPLLSRRD